MHLDQYIFEAYTVSPEFYFEIGISRALDLHTGLTVRKKNILSCQDMYILTNNTQYTTNRAYLHPTPTGAILTPRLINLPFVPELLYVSLYHNNIIISD